MHNIASFLLSREQGANSKFPPGGSDKAISSWAEADFIRHSSSKYVELRPSPRSSIAAAYSPDGRYLASTHGDHTVKLTDVATGKVVHSLAGHRRTPWVVRFSSADPDLMASGSLDFTVAVWRVSTGKMLYKYDFGKPIASLAFDPSGTVLVVSAGHKVFSWQFSRLAAPIKVLKTRRSLRALHFHPTAPHILLTAEVTERRVGGGDAGVGGGGVVAAQLQAAALGQAAAQFRQAAAVAADEGHDSMGPVQQLGAFLAAHNSAAPHAAHAQQQQHMALPAHGQPGAGQAAHDGGFRFNAAAHHHRLQPWLPGEQQGQGQQHQQRQGQRGQAAQQGSVAQGHQAAPAAAWPLGLLRAAQGLFSGVTGVFTGGAAHHAAAGAATVHPGAGAGAGIGGAGASGASGSSAAAPAVAAGDGRIGAGAPSVNPGGARSSLPGDDAAAAAAVAAAGGTGFGGGGLSILSPAAVVRHQSMGGGVLYAIPLVAPPAVASPPPSPQPLGCAHLYPGAAGGGPAAAYLSAYDLGWGWDHALEASESELERQRQMALRSAPDLPGSENHDTPCIVTVRLWDFRDPCRELHKELLVLPRVVLCSEMGIHFSPCGRYLACCVLRDSPSEAGMRWQAQQHAAAAAAAAKAARTRDCTSPHPGGPGASGDGGGAASAAMELGSGPGSPCSCRSVEMADAELGSRDGRQWGDAAAGGEPSVAWRGGAGGRGRRRGRGGATGGAAGGAGHAGDGGGFDGDEDEDMCGDTATQANCCRGGGGGAGGAGAAAAFEDGGECGGVGAGGGADDGGGPAASAVCGSALRAQHTVEAAACTAASRPGAAGGGPEYDSAAAAACRRLTAAAGGGEYYSGAAAAATAAALPAAAAAATCARAASAISGVAPEAAAAGAAGAGAGASNMHADVCGPVASRAAVAAAEVGQHHPRRGRAPQQQRPPHQPLPQAPMTRARARAPAQEAAAAAAMQRAAAAAADVTGAAAGAGPSRERANRSDPGAAASRAAAAATLAAAAGSGGGAVDAAAARQTPSTFASIKAHLALHRSREAAAAAASAGGDGGGGDAAGGGGGAAAASQAAGAGAAAAAPAGAADDAGRVTAFGGGGAAAVAADGADDAATAAALPPPSVTGATACYELCIFFAGASPLPPSAASPTAAATSASPSAASSIAFPAAADAAPSAAAPQLSSHSPHPDHPASHPASGGGGSQFGSLLHARPILAAHCVTSVQLSPTGTHVLLAYGRRHISLCSLVATGGGGGGGHRLAPVHSVVEIFSVPDLLLRRVLLSAEDEVNVAVFGTGPAQGLAYGTKEGRLRLLRYDRRPPQRSAIPFAPPPPLDDDPWEADPSTAADMAASTGVGLHRRGSGGPTGWA